MPMTDIDHIAEIALLWHQGGRQVALATVMETWGSAPRRAGSQLVVAGDGQMMGSVSGGCVEGAVIEEALTAIGDGQSRVLTFGVSDDNAFAVGLACGGTIRILVEPIAKSGLREEILADLVAAREARQRVAYIVNLETWERKLAPFGARFDERFRKDQTGVEGAEFIAIHNPAPRLIVVGAVHIAQALLPMARACGHAPSLVDPRGAFGSVERFPGETIVDAWPDEALGRLGLDARTAVLTLTHDPKLDDPAIRAALGSPVYYLGCLGSKRTHAKRVERLTVAGFGADDLARIHAPVGLDLGAANPAEIALSIMADITLALRQGA